VTEKLRAAVIGCGSMGQNHVRVFASMPGVELVGVADPNEKALRAMHERYRVNVCRDYHEMLSICTPDIVSIVTPNESHVDIAKECLSRSIGGVLIEKPVAPTLAAAESLAEAACHGGIIAVGHIERFNPAVAEILRQLELSNLGTVYDIRAERLSPWPMRIKGTGVALDLALHDVDLLRYIMHDDVVAVQAETFSRNREREDMVSAVMRFTRGAIGTVTTNWLTPRKVRRICLTGSNAYVEANLITQEVWIHDNDGRETQFNSLHGVSEGNVTNLYIPRQEPLVLELEDFVDAVRKQRPPRVTLGDAIESLKLALLLQQG
jgi:predicted dehydrogenase